jgi:phospholipid/cholesterol/gamma-HCH transport system substrate-binding protein
MPTAAQVAWAKFRVSVMIGCATAIASVLVYLLLGGSEFLQPSVTIHAYMIDLSGLQRGSHVRFNGILVGEVTHTELSHLKDPKKVVRVDMSIRQHFLKSIPEDSTVALGAETLLGDKFADINEGKSPRQVQPGAELLSPPPKNEISMGDLITAAREILARMDGLFGDIEAGRGEFGKFVKGEEVYNSLLNKVAEFQRQIRAATSKDTQAGRLIYDEALYDGLRAPVKRLDQALSELQGGRGAGGKFLKDSAQYDQFRRSVGQLNRALADLNAGKGQAGKLVKDDELYTQINRMIDNLNAQVDALNSGEGAIGQLMVSTSLYEHLNGGTRNLQDMLKQLRENPRKFLYVKLF